MSVVISRRRSTAAAALIWVTVLYGFAKSPSLEWEQKKKLASRFSFARYALPHAGGEMRFVRPVHPSLRRISAWISTLGAGVALGDADGDGLSNDICLVDPRTDTVQVSPAPSTPARYASFTLNPSTGFDRRTMAPMGCIIADLNEDGLMDFLVYYWGRTPLAFLRNNGRPGQASEIRATDYDVVEIVDGDERWYSNAGFVADLDGDGHLDIVIGNYFKDGARILDATASGSESMHSTKSRSYNGGSKHILRWEDASPGPHPTVRYREMSNVFSDVVTHGWTLGAGAADIDGDLLPEIYFAHDFGPDRLLHNRSTPGHLNFVELETSRSFATPASFVMGHDSFKGMGVDFADINNDGIPDIYVSNIADDFALQESHFLWLSTGRTDGMRRGEAPYVQASEKLGLSRSGWGWDTRLADFDNDGVLEAVQATGFMKGSTNRWPELQALGTGNDSLMHDPGLWPRFQPGDDVSGNDHDAFFVKHSDGRYYDIAPEIGLGDVMISRGLSAGDIDGDGRIDLVVANQWSDSYVLRNTSPRPGAFLGLHLMLPVRGDADAVFRHRPGHPGPDLFGRPAIGAAASLLLADGRRLSGQVDGGSGHSGKRSPDLHFGLGQARAGELLKVQLRWRNASGVPCSRTIELTPGWHTVLLGS